jgi:hypothetical protein
LCFIQFKDDVLAEGFGKRIFRWVVIICNDEQEMAKTDILKAG